MTIIAIVGAYVAFQKVIASRWHFVLPALLVGLAYLAVSVSRGGRSLAEFGIRRANLGICSLWCIGLTFAALGAGLANLWQHSRDVPVNFWLLLGVYPVWGCAQQFLFQSLFHEDLRRLGTPGAVAALATVILFILVHYPSRTLMVYTAVGGVAFSFLYARYRNVIPLGFAHGWCGAIVYHLILHRDPLLRWFHS